jgi:hypothetical protein
MYPCDKSFDAEDAPILQSMPYVSCFDVSSVTSCAGIPYFGDNAQELDMEVTVGFINFHRHS